MPFWAFLERFCSAIFAIAACSRLPHDNAGVELMITAETQADKTRTIFFILGNVYVFQILCVYKYRIKICKFVTKMKNGRTYIAIDLKSFYASVECVERGLNPLTANLVVADESRTEKTICLAVSPSLKAYGIGGRARLFEVIQKVREINIARRRNAPLGYFTGKSTDDVELRSHPELELDFIRAVPRMAFYIDYSTRIYDIYLKYVAPEDIHVYSIDEVFMDVTDYLSMYKMTAHELARAMILDVLNNTGITATAGIGTNMYLCKVAMDIVAKHITADKDGVRIAELDEMSYRHKLWDHRPLTDFWRVGHGIAERLAMYGIDTMGKIARYSIECEELFYKLLGVNAELLIDHAWGWEPCTIRDVKAYRPDVNSMSNGQVLHEPYTFDKARIVAMEMADAISLDLVEKHLVTNQIVLAVGYDRTSLDNPEVAACYNGELAMDYYGRVVPKHVHGTINLGEYTSSGKAILSSVNEVFDKIVDKNLLVRRLNITACHIVPESDKPHVVKQLELFMESDSLGENEASREKERKVQEAMLSIKHRFGKNAILKGINYEEGATGRERNCQIGGHKA